MTQKTYDQRRQGILSSPDFTPQEKNELLKELAKSEFGPSPINLGELDALLTKMESSKMRQQAQKSTEGRRDIFAQGLASMMSNF
jgi:hypothetical protein